MALRVLSSSSHAGWALRLKSEHFVGCNGERGGRAKGTYNISVVLTELERSCRCAEVIGIEEMLPAA